MPKRIVVDHSRTRVDRDEFVRYWEIIMRQKKSRPSRLKAVLSDLTRSPVTLADIDTELAEIKQMWTLLIGMRQALAKDSGITEPPPSPPGADRAMLHGAVIKRKNSRH